jgi:hypothetical protein
MRSYQEDEDEFWGIKDVNKRREKVRWEVEGRVAHELVSMLEENKDLFKRRLLSDNYLTHNNLVEIDHKQGVDSTIIRLLVAEYTAFCDVFSKIADCLTKYQTKTNKKVEQIPSNVNFEWDSTPEELARQRTI